MQKIKFIVFLGMYFFWLIWSPVLFLAANFGEIPEWFAWVNLLVVVTVGVVIFVKNYRK
jgi:hypothetical protein